MAIQTINILRDYMTCEDPAVRNKYYNLLASFYHKSEGKILSSIVEETDKITLSFTDGTAAAEASVIIPKLPGSQEISFINGLHQALNEKVTKVAGKGLSDKNFSSQEKTKLASLVNYVKPNSESIAYIDGLQNALDGKLASGGYVGTGQDLKGLIDTLSNQFDNFGPNNQILIKNKGQLTGTLQEGFVYILDGNFTLDAGEYITLPSQNIALSGYGFDVSSIKKFVAGESIFKSATGGSKNLVLKDILFISGSGKVFDITDVDGSHAIEINDVNFINCSDLGEINGYRQFTAATMGIYSCSNGLKLSGAWNGFKIANSNCFGFSSGGTLFRQGTGLTFSNRFFIDMALDLPVGAKLLDFDAGNFLNDELLQINSTILKVDGVIDYNVAEDVIPNITANNPKCLWRNNVGLPDTSLEKFINDDNVAGFYDISWLVDTYFITMTGDTTFTESDLPANLKNTQEIILYLQGDFEPTFPNAWYNNAVGTYKKGEVNQITLKFIKSGVYFMKIDNSLTIYPAPIITEISPVSFIPNETKFVTIKGDFLTPATIVEIQNISVDIIDFKNSSEIQIQATSTNNEGNFDLTISNGTSITYNQLIGVFLGTVTNLSSTNYISKTSDIDVTDLSQVIINKNNGSGTVQFIDIDTSKDFQVRFQLQRSLFGSYNDHRPKFISLIDTSDNSIWANMIGDGNEYNYIYLETSTGTRFYRGWTNSNGVLNLDNQTSSPIFILEVKSGFIRHKAVDGTIIGQEQYSSIPATLRLRLKTGSANLTGVKYIELPTTT